MPPPAARARLVLRMASTLAIKWNVRPMRFAKPRFVTLRFAPLKPPL